MAEYRGPNCHRRRPRRNIELKDREALSPAAGAWVPNEDRPSAESALEGETPITSVTGQISARAKRT